MISQSEISQIGSADLEGSGLYFDAKFWSRPSILDQTARHIYIYIWNQHIKPNTSRPFNEAVYKISNILPILALAKYAIFHPN